MNIKNITFVFISSLAIAATHVHAGRKNTPGTPCGKGHFTFGKRGSNADHIDQGEMKTIQARLRKLLSNTSINNVSHFANECGNEFDFLGKRHLNHIEQILMRKKSDSQLLSDLERFIYNKKMSSQGS